jgi:hemophore-related protein
MLMCWGTSALDAHPDANNVLTAAGMQGAGAEVSVRDSFVAHPQEFQELRGIAALYHALSQSGAPT